MFNTTSVKGIRIISFIHLPRGKTTVLQIHKRSTTHDIVRAFIMCSTTGIRLAEIAEVIHIFGDISITAPECS